MAAAQQSAADAPGDASGGKGLCTCVAADLRTVFLGKGVVGEPLEGAGEKKVFFLMEYSYFRSGLRTVTVLLHRSSSTSMWQGLEFVLATRGCKDKVRTP